MALPEFKPSPASLTPAERTRGTLRYIKRAAEVIDAHIQEHGEVPAWVLDRINRSAATLGLAVSFVSHEEERRQQPKKRSKRRRKS